MSYPRSVRTYLITLTGAILAVTSAGAQTTWYVDDDAPGDPGPGDPTISDPYEDGSADHPFDAIQEGIDAAVDGDTVLALDGTYTGVDNRDLDFRGKLITVRSENGSETCIIDCERYDVGFIFYNYETADAVVEGFEIKNASVGIECILSSPTIRDCVITRNLGMGGSIYCASPKIVGCSILGNQLGGVHCEGTGEPTIVECVLVGNGAPAISCDERCSVTITGCTIASNSGGVECEEFSTAAIANCLMVGNIGPVAYGSHGSVLKLDHCLIAGNIPVGYRARHYGVIRSAGDLSIAGCTIVQNHVGPFWWFGISCGADNTASSFINTIVRGNAEPDDPEIVFGDSGPGPAVLTIGHSNIRGGRDAVEVDGGESFELRWNPGNIDAEPVFVGGRSGTWTADAIYDPDTLQTTYTDSSARWTPNELAGKFLRGDLGIQQPIVSNGRTTITAWLVWGGFPPVVAGGEYEIRDYHLSVASPCIDAGCNCGVPADTLDLDGDGDTDEYTPFDLDGDGRFFDDPDTSDTGSGLPPVVDMGAYEFGDTEPTPCRGDLDGDRDVDAADLAILLANYRTTGAGGADGDLDCDGDVDLADLAALLGVYGTSCD